jgi:hypothetical protein
VNSPARHPKEHQPKPGTKPGDQGIERNPRGEDQPTDKGRAQQTSILDETARQPPGPGQPAGGE